MDDEDEIQSPQSPESQSRSPSPLSPSPPPHQNGRLSLISQPVTVAAAPPHHTLTLALPIQQPRNPPGTVGGTLIGGTSGGGREDCWSDGATSTLIDAWGERYLELSRGNLKQKHWQDVADIVSSRDDYKKPAKTDVQCKNRIDTLKKKYKVEKGKVLSGQGPSKWVFFSRLDRLIGTNTKITASVTPSTTPLIASKVPLAIPVGIRTFHGKPAPASRQLPQQRGWNQQGPQHFRRSGSIESNSEGSDGVGASPESSDSLPPGTFNRKRPRVERELNSGERVERELNTAGRVRGKKNAGKGNGCGKSLRELTKAILEFGECYERAETSKLQQVVEMEKQRMGFSKELELQRMQFFMKTQLELTQLKHGGRSGSRGGTSHLHHHVSDNRNNSD